MGVGFFGVVFLVGVFLWVIFFLIRWTLVEILLWKINT